MLQLPVAVRPLGEGGAAQVLFAHFYLFEVYGYSTVAEYCSDDGGGLLLADLRAGKSRY